MRKLRDTCQCERNLRYGPSLTSPEARLNIKYKPTGCEFCRQMFRGQGYISDEWRHKTGVEVSPDLATLIVLFVGSLVPAGILADKITEEKPELEWVAEFLRKWDTLEGYP